MSVRGAGLLPDLEQWQQWERGRRRVMNTARGLKHRARPAAPEQAVLHLPADEPRTLVIIEKFTPSCRQAIVAPLRHLSPRTTAVLTPAGHDVDDVMPGLTPTAHTGTQQLAPSITSVLSLGAYLGLSAPVEAWAARRDVPFHLVQHGLLTPASPPASRGAHVLAWSDDDAEYWWAGRLDVSVDVVGSQMLWEVSRMPRAEVTNERPVMLGQLHGTELTRAQALRTYWSACRGQGGGGMDYRPHPNENDAVSRALHTVMRRRSITFDSTSSPLAELGRPVVSIFSTGTLEAAMRGLPAWVTATDPPAWVRDFWRRYRLAEWGSEPTPPWPMPDEEPAAALARAVEGA